MSLYETTELLTCGLPLFERSSTRIWATIYNAANKTYTGIQYSDNYGATWTTWVDFSLTPSSPVPTSQELFRDTNGNFYFNAAPDKFIKVDSQSRLASVAFRFYPYNGLYSIPNATPPGALYPVSTRAYTWSFTEDNNGYIFVGQYQTWRKTGGQYIWRYNPTTHWDPSRASQWEMLDYFPVNEPNCWHIHAIHVNPYTNKLYVSMGDFLNGPGSGIAYRRLYVSSDQLRSATLISVDVSKSGYTGLTFTSEAVWLGDDLVQQYLPAGQKSGLWHLDPANDAATPVFSWSPMDVGNPELGVPMYYARALRNNKNEIWLSFVNDGSYAGCKSGVVVLNKSNGLASPWIPGNIWEDATLQYYDISHDGQGVIPTSASYIFVGKTQLVDNPQWKVIRLGRI
jgi:hypothetical protein